MLVILRSLNDSVFFSSSCEKEELTPADTLDKKDSVPFL